ncbi:MAG: hypothetical protein HN742_25095 [Lentisphaerae bacterium]|nr:hypothetical protein [Lentisphaerota bacterium]MBT4819761.1 hypothetical protein [Lentisphaerota bacterium]MBT5607558.1 hypothetical protein [Lentisphaerota bacterium]MBT7054581.1 hypothetical protein [Lentisphaerota bacterium]MBT7845179.1 hypothetical protein [Lentisphaerota bacterium]
MAAGMQTDDAKRAFWGQQLDAAHRFMERVMTYPVDECGEPVVSLHEAAEDAGVEVVFSATMIAGGLGRHFVLREGLIPHFVGAARTLNAHGWVLKVEDGYRTREMQRNLGTADYVLDVILGKVIWELGGEIPEPDFLFARLMTLVATAPKIGTHMSGSAIDVSVLRAADGGEVDRGGPYVELSEKTPMASPFVSAEAAANRAELTRLLGEHGFVAYPYEFWHYSQGDAYDEMLNDTGRPGRYGAVDVDVATGTVTPIPDPTEPLHTPESFRQAMEAALGRSRG